MCVTQLWQSKSLSSFSHVYWIVRDGGPGAQHQWPCQLLRAAVVAGALRLPDSARSSWLLHDSCRSIRQLTQNKNLISSNESSLWINNLYYPSSYLFDRCVGLRIEFNFAGYPLGTERQIAGPHRWLLTAGLIIKIMDNESSYDASLIRSPSLQFSVFQSWTVNFTIPLCRLLIIRRPVSCQFKDPTIIQVNLNQVALWRDRMPTLRSRWIFCRNRNNHQLGIDYCGGIHNNLRYEED